MCEEIDIQSYINDYSENYMEKVYYFCLRKTSNPTFAEDLAAEITIAILTQLHKGNSPQNFSAWVW